MKKNYMLFSNLSFVFAVFKTIEIAIPELHEMRTAHIVSIGSESLSSLNPDVEDGYAHSAITFIYLSTYLKCYLSFIILYFNTYFLIKII